jgi:release factor glutamine methyltransferase
VRQSEGWGRSSADYYRQLPTVAPDDPQRAIWERRARHFQVFIRSVLAPLEGRVGRQLKIVDLGAGNGWLSNRLSLRGHCLAAVDINLDALDGLSRTCAIAWQAFWPQPPWRRALGRAWSSLKLRREAAQFPILAATPHPQWRPSLPRRVFRRLAIPALRWSYRLMDEPRARRPRMERVAGRDIRVLPGVFDPVLFHTGAYLAGLLDAELVPPGCSVLDLGTGSGVGAVCAADWAGRVVAVDVNPQAVRCAQENITLNRLGARAEVRLGDLFAPLGDERFDVVLFNPPFLRGSAQGPFEGAFYAGDVAERFAAGLGAHLKPGGCALLLLSSLGDAPAFLQQLRWQGFCVRSLRERAYSTEQLTLFQVSPGPLREFGPIEE